LSSRFSLICFRHIRTDYTSDELTKYALNDLKTPLIFWEPATVQAFSFKQVPGIMLELQGGMTFLLTNRFVDYRSFSFSAGIVADLGKILGSRPAAAKQELKQ
jgi:hypothetical protein